MARRKMHINYIYTAYFNGCASKKKNHFKTKSKVHSVKATQTLH